MDAIHLSTPSRLHFGLIDLNGSLGRVDGSVGLTLAKPGFVLTAAKSDRLRIHGANGFETRVERQIAELREKWAFDGIAFDFEETIPSHSGLGSGTQLSLSVLHAVARLYDIPLSREEATRLSGRGGASGVGVYSFFDGGFIVDGGHRFPEQKSAYLPSAASSSAGVGPLLLRRDFPEWEILLVVPNARHISGEEEVRLFQTLCPMPPESAAHVCHCLVMGILPALAERNLPAFARSLERMQTVGWKRVEIEAQDVVVRKTMDFLRENGAYGVSMSSWGPALAAFAEDVRGLKEYVDDFLALLPHGGFSLITFASNTGADIVTNKNRAVSAVE